MQSSKQKIKHADSLIKIPSSSQRKKKEPPQSSSPILYLGVCCGQIVFIFCLQHVLWQFLCFIILKNCVLQIRRCFFSLLNNFIEKAKLQYIEFQFLKGSEGSTHYSNCRPFIKRKIISSK